jgi:membrane associated rhomboid family serine protease
MFPIRDDTPRFSTPFVTYFLIGLNLLVFFFEAALDPRSLALLIRQFAVIPSHVTGFLTGGIRIDAASALVPIFTSMFLHGSWVHVIGNMWFLWIFGDNIEDYLGHFKYLVFYLTSGVAAMALQVVLTPNSNVPNLGASGAIAGVLGAYFVLYPRARVLTWFPILFVFYLPAWIMLGYWFVVQFLSGAATTAAYAGQDRGGVAFWAHVGGFVAGIALVKMIPPRPRRYSYGG